MTVPAAPEHRVGRRFSVLALSSNQQNDKDDQKDRAEPAADVWATEVEAAAAEQNDENDEKEYQVHGLRPSNKSCVGIHYRYAAYGDQITVAMNGSQSRQHRPAAIPVRRRGTCSATRHRFDAANLTPQLPGFVTLNLSASYRLTPHVQFFASAENVTGANTTPAHVLADRCRVSGAGPNATNPWADSPLGHAVT